MSAERSNDSRLTDLVAWVTRLDLAELINEAERVCAAYTDEDAMIDLGDIPSEEGGLPVACGAPCQHELHPRVTSQAGIESEARSARLKKKRTLKRKERSGKEKERQGEQRVADAQAYAIQTECFLRGFRVSRDQLTTGPSLTPGVFPVTLEDAHEFSIVKWDGISSQPITDATGIVYAHLAGRPVSQSYSEVIERANTAMADAAQNMNIRARQRKGRRGEYFSINAGISSGNGNSKPHALRVYGDQVPFIEGLLQNGDINRISGFVNTSFKAFAPALYSFYQDRMNDLTTRDPDLRAAYSGSVFACTTFNFGPHVVTLPHKDHLNLAYGWCSITALGDFDHELGGHLVLPDLKLIIEFPQGSTILIPSALFTHYNFPIRAEEVRRTITQFSAGGIFRWISYGYQLKRDAVRASIEGEKWWKDHEGLYTKWPTNRGQTENREP